MSVPANIKFQVVPYSDTALADALATDWVRSDELQAKDHYVYLREYLGAARGLAAQTIVIEHPYVSQSYLTDYASYFALGFQSYERLCKRVHFFSGSFTRKQLRAALTTSENSRLAKRVWGSYLGCTVVKPLPQTPIGATILQPYPSTDGRVRHYPACRHYEVNLLGKRLTLDSLIFQEQDLVVSACATTALWVAFHKTAALFRTVMPSPYEITAAAKNLFSSTGRTFPNDGLDHYQIGNAIESVGLVAEMLQFDSWAELEKRAEETSFAMHDDGLYDGLGEAIEGVEPEGLEERIARVSTEMAVRQMKRYKRIIYAYLRMGLPVLLFIKGDGADSEHLVTATGYCEAPQTPRRDSDISCVAEQLERLYVHDDQLGPFARYGFTEDGRLDTKCAAPETEPELMEETANLLTLFVPLSAEIRLKYDQVFAPVSDFDALLYPRSTNPEDVVWDIYLSKSNDYKADTLSKEWLKANVRSDLASRLLPKYVWVARAFVGTVPLLELLFDATDLHTGFFCLGLTWFDADFKQNLTNWLQDPENRQANIEEGPLSYQWRYLDLLFSSLGLPLTGN